MLEWNDLEAALRYLIEGIELTKKWQEVGAMGGYIALAWVKQAQGDVDGAHRAIQTAQQLAMRFDVSELDDIFVAAHQARLWVAQGNLEAAMRWSEERGVTASSSYPLCDFEPITLAHLYLAQGQLDETLEVLQSRLQAAEKMQRTKTVIETLILQSMALQAQGETDSALATLEHALFLAEPEGYVRTFIDEGEPMARLLRLAASRGMAKNYVDKLLAAFQTPPEVSVARPSLVEPLSERELEILRLIGAGRSNREIAQELVVAESTVKTHINNIYGKLDVPSRTMAMAKARELGLL